jgi:imidazolonepropionase-like amidohydrolase
MRVSGQVISSPAGCLDLWPDFVDVHPHARLGVIVSGVEEVRRAVREQVKSGVDNVKLEASGTGVHPLRPAIEATMTVDELKAATDMAHQYGISVAVHAERTAGIKNSIRAGVDTVQHGTYIDEEGFVLLEQRPATRLVFTTGVYDGMITLGPANGYPAAARQRFVDTWPTIVGNVRRAYERAIPFAVGSDCGGLSHPHGRYARNLTLLVREVGMPVEHALRAATKYAAEAAWFADAGSLEPGKRADVVIVRGDLGSQIEAVEDEACIEVVVKAGRVVKARPGG